MLDKTTQEFQVVVQAIAAAVESGSFAKKIVEYHGRLPKLALFGA